jgi:aryl-alcohol dehydrogenase-like predicted oxidoreductase
MPYRMLGSSGLKVSPLCLGTMNFGNAGWGCDEPTSLAILDAYFERGGNFVDTANRYGGGRSEEIVGKAIQGRREDVVVATKCFFPEGEGPNRMGSTRKNIVDQAEASLRRLHIDAIDLYQLHIWDVLTPIEETLAALTDLVRAGKVRYVGCCNFTGWQMAMALERADARGYERFVTTQPQYSLLCRDIEHELLPAAQEYGVGVLAWSPLAFGMLAGKYDRSGRGPAGSRLTDPGQDDIMAPWRKRMFHDRNFDLVDAVVGKARSLGTTPVALAVRWLLEQPAVTSAIIGPRSPEQLRGNWAALDLELDDEVLDALDELTDPPETYLEFMQAGVNLRRIKDLD